MKVLDSPLRALHVRDVNQDTLSSLPAFKLLYHCYLGTEWERSLDLSALQHLPCLTELHLKGAESFDNLYKVPHLTSLQLEDTSAGDVNDPAFSCAPDLGLLQIFSSDLYALDLESCCCLERLQGHNCRIGSGKNGRTLDLYCENNTEPVQLPMGALIHLTRLHFDCVNIRHEQIDFRLFFCFTALQDLSFGCCTCSNSEAMIVGQDLTLLCFLSSLKLYSSCREPSFDGDVYLPIVRFIVTWSKMQALKQCLLSNIQVDLDDRFLELAAIGQMQLISICDCNPATPEAMLHLIKFMATCNVNCPTVSHFSVQDVSISPFSCPALFSDPHVN